MSSQSYFYCSGCSNICLPHKRNTTKKIFILHKPNDIHKTQEERKQKKKEKQKRQKRKKEKKEEEKEKTRSQ